MTHSTATGRCASCVHFRNDPAFLETAFKGLTSLSSGYGSTRGDDGICLKHDRYLSARASCGQYSAIACSAIAVAPGNAGDKALKTSTDRAIERVLMV
jgi:hypothetical protein